MKAAAGAFAPFYKALQQAVRPKPPKLGNTEPSEVRQSKRQQILVLREDHKSARRHPCAPSAPTSAEARHNSSKGSATLSYLSSRGQRSASSPRASHADSIAESPASSTSKSPPQKRVRLDQPGSSPAQPSKGVISDKRQRPSCSSEHSLPSAAVDVTPSPPSAVNMLDAEFSETSGTSYHLPSQYSDLSALGDLSKHEPVTVQLAAAFIACVLSHVQSTSTTGAKVEESSDLHEFRTRFGSADFTCINDGCIGYMGIREETLCDVLALIAASLEAKARPAQYSGDTVAQRVVSPKVLGQQTSQLLGMLRESLFFYGIVDQDDVPTADASTILESLSERQRSSVAP